MIYAGMGAGVGFIVAALTGSAVSWWVFVLVGAIVVYLLSCAVLPFAICPWCRDRRRRGDQHGNYRDRNCWVCGDERYVRLGARWLYGVGR